MTKIQNPKHLLKSTLIVLSIAVIFTVAVPTSSAQVQIPDLTFPGQIEGEGTHFEITDSAYLNITLDSSESIKLRMESVPEILTMFIEKSTTTSTNQTQITISGFLPSTTYYKFEDNYHNLTQFTTDGNGKYAYTQDLSNRHFVFIQPRMSTKFIKDDVTGGDCSLIGTWNVTTKTCTLTKDLTESVQIDNNGITFDGNGHTLTGTNTGIGIYFDAKTNVVIRNLTVKYFSSGIYVNTSHLIEVRDNRFIDNWYGIRFENSADGIVINNTIKGGGISLNFSVNNAIDSNNLDAGSIGLRNYSNHNSITNNNVSGSGYGISLVASDYNNFSGNIVSNNSFGIFLAFNSNNNNFSDNIISTNIIHGIFLQGASDNIFNNNTISDNGHGVLIYVSYYGELSYRNKIYNNNFINNSIQADVYPHFTGNIFNLPLPIGGNYWSNFDSSQEGCNDVNNDNFCDAPYIFPGSQDNYPWIRQDGWKAPPAPIYTVAVVLAESNNVPHISTPVTTQPCKLIPEKTYPNGHSKEYFEDLAYCVKDYHCENSFGTRNQNNQCVNGKVNLNFTIYDNGGNWYHLGTSTADYIDNEEYFVRDAIIETGLDFGSYDIIGVIHSGDETNLGNMTWSPQYQPLGSPPFKFIASEVNFTGTWAHEIGHILGELIIPIPNSTLALDLYPNEYHTDTNLGRWDIMAAGSRNDSGKNPPYMSSYTKEFLQWLTYDIHSRSSFGEHWISSLDSSDFGDSIFRYNLEDNTSTTTQKYYILESRNKNLKTWDSSLPEEKVLALYYIDEKGLGEYGYNEHGEILSQDRRVEIPGLMNPTNNGILNPLTNETYRDWDNLVKFMAKSDQLSGNQYRILAEIKLLNSAEDFPYQHLAGVIMRPNSDLAQKIHSTRLAQPISRESSIKGIIKNIIYKDDPPNTPIYIFKIGITESDPIKEFNGKTLDVIIRDLPSWQLGFDILDFKISDNVYGKVEEISGYDLVIPGQSRGPSYFALFLERSATINSKKISEPIEEKYNRIKAEVLAVNVPSSEIAGSYYRGGRVGLSDDNIIKVRVIDSEQIDSKPEYENLTGKEIYIVSSSRKGELGLGVGDIVDIEMMWGGDPDMGGYVGFWLESVKVLEGNIEPTSTATTASRMVPAMAPSPFEKSKAEISRENTRSISFISLIILFTAGSFILIKFLKRYSAYPQKFLSFLRPTKGKIIWGIVFFILISNAQVLGVFFSFLPINTFYGGQFIQFTSGTPFAGWELDRCIYEPLVECPFSYLSLFSPIYFGLIANFLLWYLIACGAVLIYGRIRNKYPSIKIILSVIIFYLAVHLLFTAFFAEISDILDRIAFAFSFLFTFSVVISIVLTKLFLKIFSRYSEKITKKHIKYILGLILFCVILFFLFILSFGIYARIVNSSQLSTVNIEREEIGGVSTFDIPKSKEVSLPDSLINPDLDLHLFCKDGKHIGTNYETGKYETQIEGAIVSGDNQGSPEWIFVPTDITNCRFVTSAADNAAFLKENPDIASQITDKTDNYEVYYRYIDPQTNIYTSATTSQIIEPGGAIEHQISGTSTPVIGRGEITASSLKAEIELGRQLNLIDNDGIKNSLISKLDNAQKQIDSSKKKTAINILNALINEIKAQSDQHITIDFANLLVKNTRSLIDNINSLNSTGNKKSAIIVASSAAMGGIFIAQRKYFERKKPSFRN